MLVETPYSMLNERTLEHDKSLKKKVRTSGSHFLFNDKTSIHNRESDRSGNTAMQHESFYSYFRIYGKSEMLRCRLERRARFFFAEAKKNSPNCPLNAGSADNANSQFRTGQENWDDTISIFQQSELNWYLSAKDILQQAVTATDGETQFQTNAIPQANQLQTQITNSETNTTGLYNAATGLYQTYQYAAAGNVMQQAITNLQNQTSWNGQGANLSQTIADSFGRSEAYKTAELSASNRINALAQTIYGNGAYIVDNTELQTLQTQITTSGQNQTFWQNEINGTNGGFNFNGRNNTSQAKETLYTNMIADIAVATTLQAEVVDEEITYLKTANEYFEKSEKYQELADKARSEAKFDEAALYTGYAVREKNNALGYLKKKYYSLGEEITSEVDNRGLTYTKNSFLSYRDNLLNKNFQNSTQINKQIQEGKNAVAGIISVAASP
ncbi:hypothetical protein LEP1GSC125_2951 [Leptospira mayottensis 200901122]|uniref:Uncharacterized protein n=1 Tax=Leptospira mayottensis 200901122 TaxID=1193010 RepID=A0AA87SW66_9LEPT|nr:hypothetical protein LEP1GSC125_2951 [Leptospira mayottensis 200901122]